jgi:hypothetical protein
MKKPTQSAPRAGHGRTSLLVVREVPLVRVTVPVNTQPGTSIPPK